MFTLSSPLFAFLELTATCNNRCPGCGNVFARHGTPPPLSAAQWRQILEQLRPHAVSLRVTGGEPTLHPEFEAILRTIQILEFPFILFTNARWPNPNHMLAFLSAISQCSGLLISLHGAAPTSHEAFTGVLGSFQETVANIRRAVAAGLAVTTSTVITHCNWDDVEEIVALSRALGARHAVFNRYLGLASPEIEPTSPQLRSAVRTLERLRRETIERHLPTVKFGNCIPQCWEPSSSSGCLAGVAYCTVDPWGNVRPCNHAPITCGNLMEQSIEEIWHGKAMNQWREMVADQCGDCREFEICHGGCRAVAMLRGVEKDPLRREPVLAKASERQEELVLYEDACPVGRFTIRAEEFGYVLIRGSRFVLVAKAAKPVLDVCDGAMTLHEIRERFGQQALDFVGSLMYKGLIELMQ
jgi:radical SAM protein with 4Fe4S-binding SPASM domain